MPKPNHRQDENLNSGVAVLGFALHSPEIPSCCIQLVQDFNNPFMQGRKMICSVIPHHMLYDWIS